MRAGIVARQPCGADEVPYLVEDLGRARRLEEAGVEVDDLIPPPAPVQAQPPVGLKRELHLVAVVPRLAGGDDRVQRDVAQPAIVAEALRDDGVLRAQLRRVIEVLPETSPAGAEVRAP